MNFLQKLAQYHKELKIWTAAGKPERSDKEMATIHKICTDCPNFQKNKGTFKGADRCGICECNLHPTDRLLNKISWGTTECPDDPPKWGPNVKDKGSSDEPTAN